MARSLTEIC